MNTKADIYHLRQEIERVAKLPQDPKREKSLTVMRWDLASMEARRSLAVTATAKDLFVRYFAGIHPVRVRVMRPMALYSGDIKGCDIAADDYELRPTITGNPVQDVWNVRSECEFLADRITP